MSISDFFSRDGFMPHGHCYFWQPAILWLNVASDVLIAAAYFCIPVTLVVIVRRRKDLVFNWMFYMFAVFILGCGCTHIMDVITTWSPYYGLSGVLKALTAVASVGTAALLWPLIPVIEALPSFTALDASRRSTEQKFAGMANSIPQLAWMTDASGWIYWYNQRWYDYTGTTLAEVQGWGWSKVHHPDHLARVTKRFQEFLATGEPWEDTFPLRSKDGQWRWFLSRAEPLRDERGQIINWLGTNTDITEVRDLQLQLEQAKEQAEASNRSKSEFLANMSHEIRTPLNAILGFTRLLQEGDTPPEEQAHYLQTVQRNGENLTRLIDDILDLSKVEAGKLQTESLVVSPGEIIADVLAAFAPAAKGKALTLQATALGDLPAQVMTDPTRFRQILINLVGNAVKFSDQGTIDVCSRWHQGELAVLISDQGPGISPNARQHLFQPFMQADSSTTRRYGGTGLGLALARRLARTLGGDLELLPPGTEPGCTFALTIKAPAAPAATAPSPVSLGQTRAGPTTSSALAGLQVLLAEDTPDNQLYVRKILERSGIRLDIAGNGEEAVRMSQLKHYDLILMDMQMPVLDGYQATETLRRLGFQMPIIALTAHALATEREKSLAAGCSDHVTKPIAPKKLLAVIALHTARGST